MARDCFGGTVTFRKGQVGRWAEALSDREKDLVREHLGDIISDLGYAW